MLTESKTEEQNDNEKKVLKQILAVILLFMLSYFRIQTTFSPI